MDEKNFFSIGEIAKAVGVTRKIILNYEAKGLIKPDKKEGSNANRYYSIDTFTQIRSIRVFQNLGLSLDEIREYFNESADLAPVIKRLERMRDELNLTIEKLEERTRKQSDTIKIITVSPQAIYFRTYNAAAIEDKTNLLRDTALEAMTEYGTDITKRMYFIEYDVHSPNEISYCVAVPPESKGEFVENLSEQQAISIFHHGAYESIPETRKKLFAYAKEKGIALSGKCRHVYLEGPPQHKDKNRFITQILALIEEA